MTTTKTSTPVAANVPSENWLVVNATDATSAQATTTQLSVGTAPAADGNVYHAHAEDLSKFLTGATTLASDVQINGGTISLNDATGFQTGRHLVILEGYNANAEGRMFSTDGYISETRKVTAVGTSQTPMPTPYYPFFMGTLTNGLSGIGNVFYPASLTNDVAPAIQLGQAISGKGVTGNATVVNDLTAFNALIITSVSAALGVPVLNVASSLPSSLVAGLSVSGAGIQPGSVISAVGEGTLTLSQNTTAVLSGEAVTVSGYVMSSPASLTSDGVIVTLGGSSSSTTTTIPISTITTTTVGSGGNYAVTVTTTEPHGFANGDTIVISGVTPDGYDGSFTITVTSATSFTYTVGSSFGAAALASALAVKTITATLESISAETASGFGTQYAASGPSTFGYSGGMIKMTVPEAGTYAGDMFFTEGNHSMVTRTDGAGNFYSFSTSFNEPYAIAADGAGNLIVSDGGNSNDYLYQLDSSATKTTYVTGMSGVTIAMAWDPQFENLYAFTNSDIIYKIPAGGGSFTVFCANPPKNVWGMCSDGTYLYVSTYTGQSPGPNTIYRIDSSGTAGVWATIPAVDNLTDICINYTQTIIYALTMGGDIYSIPVSTGVPALWDSLPSGYGGNNICLAYFHGAYTSEASFTEGSTLFNFAGASYPPFNPYPFMVGSAVTGFGVAANTTIVSLASNGFIASQPATATESTTPYSPISVEGEYLYVGRPPAQDAFVLFAIGGGVNTDIALAVTTAANTFATGTTVTVAGVTPSDYNGSFVITVTSPTTFTYPLASQPITGNVSSASVTSTPTASVSNLTSVSTSATYSALVTTSISHGFASGVQPVISGTSVASYDGAYAITVTGDTTFTYPLTAAYADSTGGYASLTVNLSSSLTGSGAVS